MLSRTEKKERQVFQPVHDYVLALCCFLVAYLGDVHGYNPQQLAQVFEGDVWPLIEGSGHSVTGVALLYGLLSLANRITQEPISKNDKSLVALVINLSLELAGGAFHFNSVVDVKDVAVVVGTVVILFLTEGAFENLEAALVRIVSK